MREQPSLRLYLSIMCISILPYMVKFVIAMDRLFRCGVCTIIESYQSKPNSELERLTASTFPNAKFSGVRFGGFASSLLLRAYPYVAD